MASTQQLQCTGRMPGKCHTKDSSWQTTSRGCPLPSEKTMAYRNSHVVRAASKLHVLEDCTTRTTANWITNIKQATTASKSRQGKNQQTAQAPKRWYDWGRSVLGQQTYAQCAVTTSDSITSSGGKQSSWFKSNWQAGTYKWCTRSLGALVGKNTLMIQVQGKSWSHWQLRTLQKASDMSPSRASAAKQFNDTHHAIGVWFPAFRHHPSKH